MVNEAEVHVLTPGKSLTTNTSAMRLAFLLYDSRSGSTLLSSRLHRIAGLNVIAENNLVSKVLFAPPRVNSPESGRQAVDRLFEDRQLSELGVNRQAFYDAFATTSRQLSKQEFLEQCLQVLFVELRLSPGKVTLIKNACYEGLEEILSMWNTTKFIHIVRDGRGVYNSTRLSKSLFRAQAMNDNVVSAARSWSRKVKAVQHHPACLTIRYEDLLDDEARVITKILEHLEIPTQERGLDRSREEFASKIGNSQRDLHQLVGGEIKKSRGNAWQEELERPLALAYEVLAGKTLVDMNYPLSAEARADERLRVYGLIVWHWLKLPIRTARVAISSLFNSKDFRLKLMRRFRRIWVKRLA